MEPIKIDTGLLHIPLVRDGKDVGTLDFNPSDQLFAEKFYALIRNVREKQNDLSKKAQELDAVTEADEFGIPTNAGEKLAFQREVCAFIRTELDGVFGKGTSQMVFGDALSLEVITQFMNGVTPFIQAARQEKINQYTPGKKSHRAVMK